MARRGPYNTKPTPERETSSLIIENIEHTLGYMMITVLAQEAYKQMSEAEREEIYKSLVKVRRKDGGGIEYTKLANLKLVVEPLEEQVVAK